MDEKLDKIRMGPDPILLKEGDKKFQEGKEVPMKEENRIKLRFSILTVILLFLTAFTLPASNRSTTSAFGSRSMTAISQTASIPKRPQQIYIVFHYEITFIYIFILLITNYKLQVTSYKLQRPGQRPT
ncbi:MAG: hypothetical protein DRP47_12815, partial [Candidatus Zixiibacteriota bacterium]